MEPLNLIRKFTGRATYQITVEGNVDQAFMKSINNLTVTHTVTKDKTL